MIGKQGGRSSFGSCFGRICVVSEFVVSVKRSQRAQTDRQWKAGLAEIAGATVLGEDHPYSVQVMATNEARTEIERLLGRLCHVNPVRLRRPL